MDGTIPPVASSGATAHFTWIGSVSEKATAACPGGQERLANGFGPAGPGVPVEHGNVLHLRDAVRIER